MLIFDLVRSDDICSIRIIPLIRGEVLFFAYAQFDNDGGGLKKGASCEYSL
jgi:hypothetical protein